MDGAALLMLPQKQRAVTLTRMQVEDRIEQCAIEAAVGLFGAYGVNLVCADFTECAILSDLELCGMVGFFGGQVRGTFMAAVTAGPLSSSNETGSPARDWMGEITNQLFGRVKNRMLRYGLPLFGTVPAVIHGDHLQILTDRTRCRPIIFGAPAHGKVCIWIDYGTEAQLPVSLSSRDVEANVPQEGSILLF